MANTLITPSVVAREALMLLESNMVFAQLVHRDYEQVWNGSKKGDTVTIRQPTTFVADEFATTVTVQNLTEDSVGLVLEKHFDVTLQVTSQEWKLSLENFSEQVVEPAMIALAEGIDAYGLAQGREVYNWMGTASDPPDSLADLALVNKALQDQKVPVQNRFAIIDTQAEADMLVIDNVISAEKRGDAGTALREASLGRVMKVDWFAGQNVVTQSVGSVTGDPAVTGANAVGATTINLTCDADDVIDFNEGDIINFAGDTQDYVVTGDLDVANSSTGNALISPSLQVATTGTEAVTLAVSADHVMNLAFHKNAFAMAVIPLELPRGASNAAIVNNRGFAIRVVFDYISNTKTDTISFDLLCGAKCIHPELAVRVLG